MAAIPLALCCACARTPEFDVVIAGGTVYDGTGTPEGVRRLDVGLRGDRVASIGDLSGRTTRVTIDAENRAIAPGFIDVYARSGTTLLADGNGESHVRQGITTEVIGDGGPAYWTATNTPAADRSLLVRFDVTVGSSGTTGYLDQLSSRGTSLNVATLVPLSSLSAAGTTESSGPLTTGDLAKMQEALEEAMRAGAFGLSIEPVESGGRTFTETEQTALARIVAQDGGLYVATLRGDAPLDNEIRQAVKVADAARLPLMIANLNLVSGQQRGTLGAAMPPFREAAARGIATIASVTGYSDDETDLRVAMAWPGTVIGTDTAAVRAEGELSRTPMPPAAYGAFPRFLGEFVRDKRLVELPEAIRRITALPASQFHLTQRGFIREHYFADLVIFDPNTIASRATAAQPSQYPTGIDYVFVNGVLVVTPKGHTGAHPGRVLLGPAARASGR